MDCADVLQHGIFRIVKIKSYENSVSDYYEFIMNVDENEAHAATDAGIDLSIPVDGAVVPLKGDFSDTEWSTWSKKRQRLVKSNLTKTLMIDSFSRIADKAVVEAWSKCMSDYLKAKANKNNLTIEVSAGAGKFINVIVELNVIGAPVVKAKIESWSVHNAKLHSGTEPTELQGMNSVQLVYERINEREEVVIAIDTSRGTLFEVVPPVPQPEFKRIGQDFGAAATTQKVSVTVDFDQEIRVWGGCVAAYEQSGDPQARMWLYENEVGSPIVATQSEWVGMVEGMPSVELHGFPFRGTVVKKFDFTVPVKAGETKTYIGYTKNEHAKAVAFLIFIDYWKMPKTGQA